MWLCKGCGWTSNSKKDTKNTRDIKDIRDGAIEYTLSFNYTNRNSKGKWE